MRIVFFNRSYYPDTEATGQLLTELAQRLAKGNHHVSVVCGRSYHVKTSSSRSCMPLQREQRHGVRILRVLNTTLPKSSFWGRLVNLGTYFAGCLVALLLLPRPDVVVAETDPPLLPWIGAAYARLVGARFVFVVNDLYPDIAIELDQVSSPLWLALLQHATDFGVLHADKVVVLGEDMAEKVQPKTAEPDKIEVIRSWTNTERIKPQSGKNKFRNRHGYDPDTFLVMYSGNLGLSQPLDDVLRAFVGLDLSLAIVGEGANKQRLVALRDELGLEDTVRFFPYQPLEDLSDSLGAADLHLIPLKADAAGSIVPCKVYGIMAAGRPFLAIMDESSEVVRIGRRHDCGMWCPPGSPELIREKILSASEDREKLREMGRRGRRAAVEWYSTETAVQAYEKVFSED